MAYIPKTDWKLDDTVMPDDMNRIEQGVAENKEAITEVNSSLSEEVTERKSTMWNPNILYNSYFLNPVNQRSLLEYTTNGYIIGYTIDGWLLQKETATLPPILKITANGIEITAPADGNVILEQVIEFPERYKKMPLTFSVKFSEKSQGNGQFTVYSHNGTIYETVTLNEAIPINHGGKIMSTSGVGNEVMRQLRARIMAYRGTTLIVESAKLELGTISTLANDPPQDYGTELAKCQRYFKSYKNGELSFTGRNTTQSYGGTQIAMRATPTVTIHSVNDVTDNQTISAASCMLQDANSTWTGQLICPSGALQQGHGYNVVATFSAEL